MPFSLFPPCLSLTLQFPCLSQTIRMLAAWRVSFRMHFCVSKYCRCIATIHIFLRFAFFTCRYMQIYLNLILDFVQRSIVFANHCLLMYFYIYIFCFYSIEVQHYFFVHTSIFCVQMPRSRTAYSKPMHIKKKQYQILSNSPPKRFFFFLFYHFMLPKNM